MTYDPRFGEPRFGDPRFGDPRFGDLRFAAPHGLYDPRLGYPSLDARLGVSNPTLDPRLGFPIPTYNPRFGFAMSPTFDSRFSQPIPMQDPRLGSWAGPTPIQSPSVVAPLGSNRRLTALPTDEEIEEIVFEILDHDPRIPLDADIDVKCEAGRVTLAGTVPDKRIKHVAGEVAWWIPGVTDVNNSVVVSGRRQAQATRRRRLEPGATGR
jgi:hypothetical protein